MSTRIILIRHGETDWNRKRRYCSFSDIGLNKKGRQQAKELSKKLCKERVHKIYSSDMKRALQFAKLVFKGRVIERLYSLREINFGVFEGLTYEEAKNKYPRYKTWLQNPLVNNIPRGEGLKNLAERTRKTLRNISYLNKDKTIAVFTHAGPIGVILCDIFKLELKDIWQLRIDLASINIIKFDKDRGKARIINDTSYLNG